MARDLKKTAEFKPGDVCVVVDGPACGMDVGDLCLVSGPARYMPGGVEVYIDDNTTGCVWPKSLEVIDHIDLAGIQVQDIPMSKAPVWPGLEKPEPYTYGHIDYKGHRGTLDRIGRKLVIRCDHCRTPLLEIPLD